jgi:hypothetical protein
MLTFACFLTKIGAGTQRMDMEERKMWEGTCLLYIWQCTGVLSSSPQWPDPSVLVAEYQDPAASADPLDPWQRIDQNCYHIGTDKSRLPQIGQLP